MLLHTVLATVYGGLLVSARHLDIYGNLVEDVESTDESHYAHNENNLEVNDASEDDVWGWMPDAPQQFLQSHFPTPIAEDQQPIIHWPDIDIPEPQLPHDFPRPPQHRPVPPHHPHEAPKKGPFPGGHDTNKTIYQVLQSQPQYVIDTCSPVSLFFVLRTRLFVSFSRIFKLVNATEEVTKLLNDSAVKYVRFSLSHLDVSDFPS